MRSRNLYLYVSMFIYIIALEYNLYYKNLYFVVSWLGFLLFASYTLSYKVAYKTHDIYWAPVVLLSFYIAVSSAIYQDLILSIKGLFIIIVFYFCYVLYKLNLNVMQYFLNTMYLFAGLSYIIQINNGEFIFWEFLFSRNASVFFDPNYTSALFAVSSILSLILINNVRAKILSFLFFFCATILTYSKGGVIGCLIGLLFYLYNRYGYKSLPIVITLLGSALFVFMKMEVDLEKFRFVQGFNQRDEFFFKSIHHVFFDGNLFGNNSSMLSEIVFGNKYEHASTHNYYIDLLLTNGIIPFLFIFIIMCNVFYNGIIFKSKYFPVFILMLAISNSISISIGGIGILSFIYTYAIVSILNEKRARNSHCINHTLSLRL